jgi:hypothetical protein
MATCCGWGRSSRPKHRVLQAGNFNRDHAMYPGSCLCGSVRFTVLAALEAPVACHCTQCRKQTGHFFASTNVLRANLQLQGQEHITWFQSSAKVRRGFCSKCGSTLFWDPPHKEWTSIAMGAFDAATQTHLERHIFVADKGDYYAIGDGLPQNEQ